MATVSTLGAAVKLHHAVDGTTECVLARHRTEPRLSPLIRYHELDGSEHILELSPRDVTALMRSLVTMFAAEQPEITAWWRELTAGKDNRGT